MPREMGGASYLSTKSKELRKMEQTKRIIQTSSFHFTVDSNVVLAHAWRSFKLPLFKLLLQPMLLTS